MRRRQAGAVDARGQGNQTTVLRQERRGRGKGSTAREHPRGGEREAPRGPVRVRHVSLVGEIGVGREVASLVEADVPVAAVHLEQAAAVRIPEFDAVLDAPVPKRTLDAGGESVGRVVRLLRGCGGAQELSGERQVRAADASVVDGGLVAPARYGAPNLAAGDREAHDTRGRDREVLGRDEEDVGRGRRHRGTELVNRLREAAVRQTHLEVALRGAVRQLGRGAGVLGCA